MNTATSCFVSITVRAIGTVSAFLIISAFAICAFKTEAQGSTSLDITNSFPPRESSTVVSGPQVEIDNYPYPNEQDLFKLEFLGDNRRTLNGDYESLSSGGMALLFAATDRESVGLSLEAGVVQLARGSLAAATATDPSFVEIGFIGRHYFTPSHVFLRPYASFNLSYFWMTWDYRTPILLDDGTSVSWDWIEGVDVSAAVGLAVHLHRNVDLFGEFCGGGVGLVSPTGAGLDNNIFGNFGYVGVKAGFSVVF